MKTELLNDALKHLEALTEDLMQANDQRKLFPQSNVDSFFEYIGTETADKVENELFSRLEVLRGELSQKEEDHLLKCTDVERIGFLINLVRNLK